MKLTVKDFDDFWAAKGQFMGVSNPERIKNNLREYITENENSDKLDNHVRYLRLGKESTRQIVVAFYDYLKRYSVNGAPDSDLYKEHYYDNPVERQLEIAKFLHEPKTTGDIVNKFQINDRTARSDLQSLEEGITILDSVISVKKKTVGRKHTFQTSVHPIFLPLNLTEVYAVTRYLDDILPKNDPLADAARGVIQRIVDQLSPYALEKIQLHPSRKPFNNYHNETDYLKSQKNIQMYLLKSGRECPFTRKGKEYVGRIKNIDGNFRAVTNKGEVLDADLNDVEFLFDEIEYK